MAIFLYLATQWKQIMTFWHSKELPFLSHPYKRLKGFSLNFKIRSLGALFFILYLIEHITFLTMMQMYNEEQIRICNVTSITPLNNFMRRVRPHLLEVLPFHWAIWAVFQWLISQLAFGWNFVDYFLSILSLAIATRFKQINERMKKLKEEELNPKFWHETRIHYTALVDLLQFVDSKIAALVLISMLHNLFLLCTKIFEAIR
jgi:gustatory receptor